MLYGHDLLSSMSRPFPFSTLQALIFMVGRIVPNGSGHSNRIAIHMVRAKEVHSHTTLPNETGSVPVRGAHRSHRRPRHSARRRSSSSIRSLCQACDPGVGGGICTLACCTEYFSAFSGALGAVAEGGLLRSALLPHAQASPSIFLACAASISVSRGRPRIIPAGGFQHSIRARPCNVL